MSSLLRYRGRPVPYITAWRDEKLQQPPIIATQAGIAYAGAPAGRGVDANGVLWKLWDDRSEERL